MPSSKEHFHTRNQNWYSRPRCMLQAHRLLKLGPGLAQNHSSRSTQSPSTQIIAPLSRSFSRPYHSACSRQSSSPPKHQLPSNPLLSQRRWSYRTTSSFINLRPRLSIRKLLILNLLLNHECLLGQQWLVPLSSPEPYPPRTGTVLIPFLEWVITRFPSLSQRIVVSVSAVSSFKLWNDIVRCYLLGIDSC